MNQIPAGALRDIKYSILRHSVEGCKAENSFGRHMKQGNEARDVCASGGLDSSRHLVSIYFRCIMFLHVQSVPVSAVRIPTCSCA
jgi:hypothetical protein